MLSEEGIRAVITELAKGIAQRDGGNRLEPEPNIVCGLAWALLGERPRQGNLGDVYQLHELLKACGIPSTINPKGCPLLRVGGAT